MGGEDFGHGNSQGKNRHTKGNGRHKEIAGRFPKHLDPVTKREESDKFEGKERSGVGEEKKRRKS